jgi:tetratricopeptide (TPR) repeat protein
MVGLMSCVAAFAAPSPAMAQGFTQQVVMVVPFEGRDRRLGNSVADEVRGRLGRTVRKREVTIVDEYSMETLLEKSSMDINALDSVSVRTLARQMRADELVTGRAERMDGGRRLRVHARFQLLRDKRLAFDVPVIEAPSADSAAALIVATIVRVRGQLVAHRRCENGVRDGGVEVAIADARRVAPTLPSASLLRACVVTAMALTGADAREVLKEADQLLAEQPGAYYGIEAAARSYDALGDRARAAERWLQLAAWDTTDLALGRRVLEALLKGGNANSARPLVTRLSEVNPDDVALRRLRWQVLYAVRDWPGAVSVGAQLSRDDSASRSDSTFALRLATAHRSAGDTVRAIAVVAEGVSRFPGDPRLYLLYSELVQLDARATVERGLGRFPQVAELHLLRAQELRRAGKGADALAPLQRAMQLDSTLGSGYLALAQTQVDLGVPDSAFMSTRQALRAGESIPQVAAFALARGNALYRGANGTKRREDYQMALRFLQLADSLQGSPQSRFLVGATALSISQLAATAAASEKACDLSRLAQDMAPLAREKLVSGAQVAPDASRQYLTYLDQLEPVIAKQMEALCGGGPD